MNQIHTMRIGDKDYTLCDPNAVTPAQLEEKVKELLGILCPTLRQQGNAVRCQPVAGYPLQITTQLPEGSAGNLTLALCGKNLFDYTLYPFTNNLITYSGGNLQSSSGFSATKDFIPVSHLRGQTITLNHPSGEKTASTNSGLAFYDEQQVYISGGSKYTHTVPDNAAYMRFTVPREYEDGTQIQIELGDSVTEYEPYRRQDYVAEIQGQQHCWTDVQYQPGVNTLWSSVGTTLVEGKADPVAILEELRTALQTTATE